MMTGAWRNMTRQDWQQLQRQLLGTAPSRGHHGWSTLAIVAVTAGATLIAAALTMLLVFRRRPFKRPPAAAAT